MRDYIKKILEHSYFTALIVGLIAINCVVLALETYPEVKSSYGSLLKQIDQGILMVFVVEIVARIFVYRRRFFTDPWAIFDLVIVAIALVPANETFAVLRSLRVLRALRLISTFPQLRRLVEGLIKAIPGIASIGAIMTLVFFVFAVISAKLFGAAFPLWFGDLGLSLFTLFQIMTLEGWAEIANEVGKVYSWSWSFFILYILISTFTILNLFVAVMIDAIQQDHNIADKKEKDEERANLREIRSQLADLSQKLDKISNK